MHNDYSLDCVYVGIVYIPDILCGEQQEDGVFVVSLFFIQDVLWFKSALVGIRSERYVTHA